MTIFCSAPEFESLCRELSGKAESLRLQAKGGSMHPFIQSGDWVHVQLCSGAQADICRGDIILFRKDNGLFLHRVLRSSPGGFLVKGDMSSGPDGIIRPGDVIGRATAVEHGVHLIDLTSAMSRSLSVLIAATSVLMQYPCLFGRSISACAMAILARIPSIPLYRQIVRKVYCRTMAVREACPDDEEQLRDLYLMSGNDIREGLARLKKQGMWLVVENNKKIIGGLTVISHEKDLCLWLIFGLEVKPLCRGRGAGSLLVKEALDRAAASGAHTVGLFVNRAAGPALMLYQKAGFRVADRAAEGFNRSVDDLYLSYPVNDKT